MSKQIRVNKEILIIIGSTSDQDYSIIWSKTPGPSANVVIPSTGFPDTDMLVTIGGSDFKPTAVVDFGSDITVNTVTFVSAETLRVDISIDAAARTAKLPSRRSATTHASGLMNPSDAGFHGELVRSLYWNLGLCAQCDGEDFGG